MENEKILIKFNSFEAKLVFCIVEQEQKNCLVKMLKEDDDDYYNWFHGVLEKILHKMLKEIEEVENG